MSLIRYVTRIHFADRAMEDALPEELRARGLAAPLILADAEAGESLPRLLDCLPPRARATVVRVGPGEPGSEALAPADRSAPGPGPVPGGFPQPGDYDLVIGLGGATAIDLARLARAVETPPWASVGRSPQDPLIPTMVVPTLPGCLGLGPVRPQPGVRPSGGRLIRAVAPVPCVLFCDPSLIRHAPPLRLAVAGMDALIHSLEALLSTAWNPPADGMAFDGLRRGGRWLERLCADPGDAEARREVMAAALNGALAAQKGLGAIHALAHAAESLAIGTGGHGWLHAALVGPTLAFNAPAVPDRIAQAAEAMGQTSVEALAAHLHGIGTRLGLPADLGHLGLTPAGIARMAEAAADDPANRTNPRLAGANDYRAMIVAGLGPPTSARTPPAADPAPGT